jgi:hypothetical protein
MRPMDVFGFVLFFLVYVLWLRAAYQRDWLLKKWPSTGAALKRRNT